MSKEDFILRQKYFMKLDSILIRSGFMLDVAQKNLKHGKFDSKEEKEFVWGFINGFADNARRIWSMPERISKEKKWARRRALYRKTIEALTEWAKVFQH